MNDSSIDDTTIDGIRYAEETETRDLIDDGIDYPYLEEELKVKYGMTFLRTPRDETVITDSAKYLGIHRIRNTKYDGEYKAHLWKVFFLRANGIDFETPIKGLLEIRVRVWENRGLPDPGTALSGKCIIVANARREIVELSRLEQGR
jgi:hypothetical protein